MTPDTIIFSVLGAVGTMILGLIAIGIRSLVAVVLESNKQIAILSTTVKSIQQDIEVLFKLNGITSNREDKL